METKTLPYLIALCAFLVSGSAAFYSVYGLGKMFAGASIQVMVLAGSLEVSKLVIASFLYRYWPKISVTLKYYLAFATLLLVLITSGGIYGFLSSAYQETANKVEIGDGRIKLLNSQKQYIDKEIELINSQIENKNKIILSSSGAIDASIDKGRSINALDRQINNTSKDIRILSDSLNAKNQKLAAIGEEILKIENNPELASDIGPLKYLAQMTGKGMDEIVNWFIIALMLVFDPLAIALVISANMAFAINKKTFNKEKDESPAEAIKTEENEVSVEETVQQSYAARMTSDEPEQEEKEVQEEVVADLENETDNDLDPEMGQDDDASVDPLENLNQIIEEHLIGKDGELKKNLSVEVKEPEKITGETINTLNQQIDPTRIL